MAMNESFENYCAEIGLSSVARQRVGNIVEELSKLYNDMQFDDIFINDMDRNSEHAYTSIWLFNKQYVAECKEFMTDDNFDLTIYKDNIRYLNIRKKDYSDINNPIEKSNIAIDVIFDSNLGLTCNIIANGVNCKYAINIAKKYFIPNLCK